MDGDFCKAALEKQIYIKDELPVLMTGLTRLGKQQQNKTKYIYKRNVNTKF